MYCVQRTSERPFDGALRRIDSKDQGAGRCLPRSVLRQSNEPSKCRNHARAQQSHGAPFLCDRLFLPPKEPSRQQAATPSATVTEKPFFRAERVAASATKPPPM